MLAAGAVIPAFGAEKSNHYHDDTPLSAHHSIYSDIFIHKWLDAPRDGFKPIPLEEQLKISDTAIAHWRNEVNTRTNADEIAKACNTLGLSLFYRDRYEEAEEVFRKERDTAKWQQLQSEGWYRLAEAQLGAGKTNECIATLKKFIELDLKCGCYYNGGRSKYPDYYYTTPHILYWLEGEEHWMDDLKMPRGTDNKAFPEAQKATYTDEYVPTPRIDIVLRGVKESDPRIRLLKQKLRHRGFEFTVNAPKGGYPLAIALDPEARVAKKEGYTLAATKEKCVVKSRDLQGVLWGIVSFLQILDVEKKAMRVCDIEDWPDCPRRGYYGREWPSSCEFAVFNKMNYITHKPNYFRYAEYTPFNILLVKNECEMFSGFGLEFYGSFVTYTLDLAWPVCWNVTVAMQIEEMKKWASYGVNVYYPYDDDRYVEATTYTPEERATGLKPSETDAKRIAFIYNEVKKEYPNFKMQFCPPFYWGPTKGHPYPDDRNKYLKSIAEHLPKEIDVIWTGERVGSLWKRERDCLWFSGMIGRKPSLFQNKTGPHGYQSYVNDRTPWDKWYYPGFVTRDMAGIQKNADTPTECPQISSLADYLWNVKAYDAERAIRRGVNNYLGAGVFEALDPAWKILCYYDKFHSYGRVIDNMRWETVEQVDKDYETAVAATAKARKLVNNDWLFEHGTGVWNMMVGCLGAVRNWKRAHPNPRLGLSNEFARVEADAVALAKYRKGRDVLIDGYDFRDTGTILFPNQNFKAVANSRVAALMCPQRSMWVEFDWTRATSQRTTLKLAAYEDFRALKVVLNGETIHDGALKVIEAKGDRPKSAEVPIRAGLLKKSGNRLEITNPNAGNVDIVYAIIST